MPAETAIEWTESTWNPVTGCSKVTPGCAHCYAETFAERWRGVPGHPYEQGFDLRLWPQRLEYPLKWKRPRMIFVNSMSDIFHEDIPFEYVERIFVVMQEASHHKFQVLTKRHERMTELAPHLPWPPNVWMGVSIENKRWVLRADYLREVPAAVRFISAEPLLGPLTGLDLTDIHWLIAGGESGPGHRPVQAEWIRGLRDRCHRDGVAFFFKQWGGLRAKSGGRQLDGREWNEMPSVTYSANGHATGRKMPRQRDIPDDADEKWEYTEHSAAKHEILHRYLGAWFSILGGSKRNPRLVLLDGFAGRGRYVGGEPGSPRIMFERAAQVVDDGRAKEVWIRCAELNQFNFEEHLSEVCAELHHDHVRIKAEHESFVDAATKLAGWLDAQRPPPPTFVMVDPYGVTGVPLDLLARLLSFDRLEVLLTFMVRDPSRFLMEGNYEEPLTALVGGEAWRDCLNAPQRAECLMLRFREVVRPAIAKHATPFLVYEDARRVPLYYLIHLTNNDLGMREMKDAMVEKSGDMTFWPVTVRDPSQLELDVGEQPPYPSLQDYLSKTYAGRTMTFVELLNEDYPEGAWVEKKYRAAVKAMAASHPPRVEIIRNRTTPSGRKPRGLEYEDTVGVR
jgi:three-Cys-motif partner protein